MEKKKIHFIGIGGIGMSGIAQILAKSDFVISGSDQSENAQTEKLKQAGVKVYIGHQAQHIKEVDVVVVSSAIAPNNPELIEAHKRKIQVLSRGEMLAELMRKKKSVVVAGSHGKTTTSAMITTVLLEAGLDPTAVIGGSLNRISGNAVLGRDDWFVAESDESDGSFLHLLPFIGVITNIDSEHLTHYGSFEKLMEAFEHFGNSIPFDGTMVICSDDPNAMLAAKKITKPMRFYGVGSMGADILAQNIQLSHQGSHFDVVRDGKKLGRVTVKFWGAHNVLNALATLEVAMLMGLTFDAAKEGLKNFSGVKRRLEIKGEVNEIRVIDDYAHHPTEIKAVIAALKSALKPNQKIKIVFQPHRFTRVRDLWEEFSMCFEGASEVWVLPIYAASEAPLKGITHEALAASIVELGKVNAKVIESLEASVEKLSSQACAGDVLVTMGAGNVTSVGPLLIAELKKRVAE